MSLVPGKALPVKSSHPVSADASTDYQTVFEYYRAQDVLPTYGHFKSPEELQRHEGNRRHLFLEKLQLPPRLFRDTRLIEFGPDSGENALVFAQWGATCSLMEPNGQALPFIRHYFERYGLESRLACLEQKSVEEYASDPDSGERYDFVIAEGFAYTVKPESVWMNLFARLLKPDGFLVFYFLEKTGSFFDLFLKVIQSRMKQLTGLGSVACARQVFQTKWDSIPHIRTLESWTMDVLENPFIRLRSFNDTSDLYRGLREAGLSLYGSWPNFKHGVDTYWHKTQLPEAERIARQERFLEQSRLSFLFGSTLFSQAPLPPELFRDLLNTTEALVDHFSMEESHRLGQLLDALGAHLRTGRIYGDAKDLEAAESALASTLTLVHLLEAAEPEAITHFCNSDPAFIRTWGTPTHYLAFTKPGLASPAHGVS